MTVHRVLAIDPYHGGSHRALLDGWIERSRHHITPITLPPYHWKWRMRHAPVTMQDRLREQGLDQQSWDAVWCTSMLNLAEFLGLAPHPLRHLPAVAYFHENQLAYPVRHSDPRDAHFAVTNLTTALAADRVWFNSEHNRDTLLDGLEALLTKMPDHPLLGALEQVRAKSEIVPPGIRLVPRRDVPLPGPLRVLWAARWEHDKGPDAFFQALFELDRREVPFRLSVLGEQFGEAPEVFGRARQVLQSHLDHWGFRANRSDYETVLQSTDVVVSTAEHEFFGIAILEAVSAGCVPVLPARLAYPELFAPDFLYDGTTTGLVGRLTQLARLKAAGGRLEPPPISMVERFSWANASRRMDDLLEETVRISCEVQRA
jgi:glycosyltransferase involved in cell wall biosynthesis